MRNMIAREAKSGNAMKNLVQTMQNNYQLFQARNSRIGTVVFSKLCMDFAWELLTLHGLCMHGLCMGIFNCT